MAFSFSSLLILSISSFGEGNFCSVLTRAFSVICLALRAKSRVFFVSAAFDGVGETQAIMQVRELPPMASEHVQAKRTIENREDEGEKK